MIKISRTFTIQAAHRLPHTPPEHKCHGMHGHTWRVRLEVTGPIEPALGWIIDYADLDADWSTYVHEKLDHSVLNDTIPNPTTELIASWIWATMWPPIRQRGARLVLVEVDEGERNRCTFTADEAHVNDPPAPTSAPEEPTP